MKTHKEDVILEIYPAASGNQEEVAYHTSDPEDSNSPVPPQYYEHRSPLCLVNIYIAI